MKEGRADDLPHGQRNKVRVCCTFTVSLNNIRIVTMGMRRWGRGSPENVEGLSSICLTFNTIIILNILAGNDTLEESFFLAVLFFIPLVRISPLLYAP